MLAYGVRQRFVEVAAKSSLRADGNDDAGYRGFAPVPNLGVMTEKIRGCRLDAGEHAVLMGEEACQLVRFHERDVFHRAHDSANLIQHPEMPLDLRAFAHNAAISFIHAVTACCHCSRLSLKLSVP